MNVDALKREKNRPQKFLWPVEINPCVWISAGHRELWPDFPCFWLYLSLQCTGYLPPLHYLYQSKVPHWYHNCVKNCNHVMFVWGFLLTFYIICFGNYRCAIQCLIQTVCLCVMFCQPYSSDNPPCFHSNEGMCTGNIVYMVFIIT